MIHRFSCAFCSGTCHFVFWHGFPASLSCLTWISPNEQPHNNLTHRARVGMAPRLSADTWLSRTLLWSICPPFWCYLNSPRCKTDTWNVSFSHSADAAPLLIKLVAAHATMVFSPRFGVTYTLPIATWTHVKIRSCHSRPRGEDKVRCLHDSSAEARDVPWPQLSAR